MNIHPMRNNVLVAEELGSEKLSTMGIVIAGGDKDTKACKVLAVGPDTTSVKEGDRVLVDWAKGKILHVDGKQRVLLPEDAIMAAVN